MNKTTGADATAFSMAALVSLESRRIWNGRVLVFRNGDDLGLGRDLKSYN